MIKRAAKHGFSLLEIITVLALVVMALGILLYRTKGLNDQSRYERARSELNMINSAVRAYYLNNKDVNGNQVYPSGSDWQSNDLLNDNPKVLRQVLYDPFRSANTQYSYLLSPNGKYYIIFSYGPNQVTRITSIQNTGDFRGRSEDDIFVTNGTGSNNIVIGPGDPV